MEPLVSLVVPTYQRRASVERLLKAIDRQTLPAEAFEVIVSIDGSEDGTREFIENYPSAYRLLPIWQPNQGRSIARNAGIQLARGEVVVLLDDDMEPSPAFLEAHYYEKDFSALARDEISKGRTAILFARKHPDAYPETKIAAARQESRAWQPGRLNLLELSITWQATPDLVVRGVRFLEKRQIKYMYMLYRFSLDYFFWLGVRDGQNHPVLHR